MVVHPHGFNHDRRRQEIPFHVLRIHRHQPLAGGKPQTAIRRPAARRLQPFRTFDRRQTVIDAISQAMHLIGFPIRTIVQLRLADPDDAAMGTHPEKSPAVLLDVADDAVGQSLLAIDHGKMSLFEPVQIPPPNVPIHSVPSVVKVQAFDEIARQAVGFPELPDALVFQAGEAAPGHAKPDGALAVFRHRAHIAQQSVRCSP